jgi:hypothetical protein
MSTGRSRPQYLHTIASRCTNSAQNGHFRELRYSRSWLSITSLSGRTATRSPANSGEIIHDKRNHPKPRRPRRCAKIPTTIEKPNQIPNKPITATLVENSHTRQWLTKAQILRTPLQRQAPYYEGTLICVNQVQIGVFGRRQRRRPSSLVTQLFEPSGFHSPCSAEPTLRRAPPPSRRRSSCRLR